MVAMPLLFSTGRALRSNARLRLALRYTLSTCAPQVRQCVKMSPTILTWGR